MPSMTTGQQGYAPAPLPTAEPVPVYQEPLPEQLPPPQYEGAIPLPSQQAAPVQEAAPPQEYAEAIPLPSRQSTAPAPVEEAAAPVEPPKDEPTVIRNLGAQTEQTKKDVGAGAGQILSGDILGGLGTIKDAAGDQMVAQGGDLFPWRRQLTDAIAQEALNGDPSADAPWQDRLKDAVLTGTGDSDPFVRFIEEDPDRTNKLMTEGYTSQGGTYTEPGTAALWEAWQDPHSGVQRAAADIFYDPSNILSIPAGAIGGAAKAPKAVQIGARAVDAATSFGLSEAVPIATKGLGAGLKKVGILAPTKTQVAKNVVEEAGSAANTLATTRRAAGGVGDTLKAVEKTGDTTVLRDPSGVLPEVTYKTGKNSAGLPTVTGIVDDPATGIARPVTEADRALILDHSRNLNWDDFEDVKGTWYREMFDATDPVTKARTSYLETHDPEIGTPMPDRVDAWNKYRDLQAHRMAMIDSVNPGHPALVAFLGQWDANNTKFLDLNGLSASERRLSALEKITRQSGTWDAEAADLFTKARQRLRTGPMDITGMEVLDARGNLGPISRASQQTLKAQQAFMPQDFYRQVGTVNSPGLNWSALAPVVLPCHNATRT
jgi:hypothetical protein